MNSDAGPWNDYVVKNKRIRHKDEPEEEKKEEEGPVSLEFIERPGAAAAGYRSEQ